MNKVIAALDALKISESTVDCAAYLAKNFNAHIVATFLEDITYHQPSHETHHPVGGHCRGHRRPGAA